ncbi:MAG: cellulase family glycosylhydrolase [candidate division WS1 bacterium]|nr:cellulase family glycosylhydrolase [candidate division WS1 bacterium]
MMDSWPFLIGVNYWASHAGAYMWRDWDPEVVARDLEVLAEHDLRTVRIFPLWPDFQPLEPYFSLGGELREMRTTGDAGLNPVMVERFGQFLEMAREHELQVIVALVTGWMSGQLFAPAALANRDLITDPRCVQWEIRLARELVRRFRSAPAILAWELGNECNCLQRITQPEEAWRWVQALADAIRAQDPTRPVLSGMWTHLDADPWRLEDLGELCDGLTAHPYPTWVPHVEGWPLGDPRQSLHAAARACLYTDLGGRPSLVEELGSLGEMYGGEQTRAEHARANLWNIWAHRGHGMLWWSAYDLTRARHRSPYDTQAIEPQLGLFDEARRPYPAAEEMSNFARRLRGLPPEVAGLPPPQREAVCVLSPGQDQWATGLMTFLLAREAGFGVRFARTGGPLPEAELYLVPSLSGLEGLPEARWKELRQRVQAGARLYLSLDSGALLDVQELLGVEIIRRGRRTQPSTLRGEGLPGFVLPPSGEAYWYEVTACGAEVLARDQEDRPLLTVHQYGQGQVFTLWAGMETGLAQDQTTGGAGGGAFAAIYRRVAKPVLAQRLVRKPVEATWLGITEHHLMDGRTAAVLVNDSGESRSATVQLAPAVAQAELLWGEGELGVGKAQVRLAAHDGAVLLLTTGGEDR